MKCILELNGEKYESTEFTERQVSLFLAASAGATGVNVKDLFEGLMGAKNLPVKGLREYSSLESAEKDLDFVLKRVFPTSNLSIDSLDTADLVTIVLPMLFALVGMEAPVDATTPTEPTEDSPESSSESSRPEADLFSPPVLADLTGLELDAIELASLELDETYQVIECWYQWWRSIVDVGGSDIDDADAFEILEDFTKGGFSIERSTRIYAALKTQLQAQPEPIAA